jgi:hypothetical protein
MAYLPVALSRPKAEMLQAPIDHGVGGAPALTGE